MCWRTRQGNPIPGTRARERPAAGPEVMSIQDFVVIQGSAPATGGPTGLLDQTLVAAAAMKQDDESELRAQLAQFRQEHRDLDAAIAFMVESGGADVIRVQRMKKRKLALKDRIARLEDRLLPDIIA